MKLFVTSLLIGLALGAPKSIEKDLETVPYTIVATHHVGDDSVSKDNTFKIPTCNRKSMAGSVIQATGTMKLRMA